MCIDLCTYTQIYIYIYIYMHIHVYTRIYVHICVYMCIYNYICVYTWGGGGGLYLLDLSFSLFFFVFRGGFWLCWLGSFGFLYFQCFLVFVG